MSRRLTLADPIGVPEPSSLQSTKTTEFINDYYALSEEPLNLRAAGQKWFAKIYHSESSPNHSVGLVLGGTPWLGSLLKTNLQRVMMVDLNPEMLQTARTEIEKSAQSSAEVSYICGNWLSMPEFPLPIDLVAGDNCLNFLQYPEGWMQFLDNLATKLSCQARLMIRFIAIPPTHKAITIDELVAEYLRADSISYTQVRAHLLLAHWRPDLLAIPTEQVVEAFDQYEGKFNSLFNKFPKRNNDLVTIRKFRGSGFMAYAPPLDDVLKFVMRKFEVTGIHFGPYGLAEYFPLITARLR